MKIMQLRYFMEVCRCKSVTKAAKELYISQPSVTSAIHEMEKEFGVNLFNRQQKKMVLTKEGEYLYEEGQKLLQNLEELEQTMKNFGGKNKKIKVGVPPMIGTFMFPKMIKEFREAYPELSIEIQEFGSMQTRQLVQNDQLDAAFVIMDDFTEKDFYYVPLIETELVLAVSKDDPLADRKVVGAEDLKDEPLILMREDSYQNAEIKKRFQEAEIVPNVFLYSSQLYTIREFVHNNETGAFLFRSLVEQDPDLVGIPFEPAIPIRIGLIWKRGKYTYNGTKNLIEFARKFQFE